MAKYAKNEALLSAAFVARSLSFRSQPRRNFEITGRPAGRAPIGSPADAPARIFAQRIGPAIRGDRFLAVAHIYLHRAFVLDIDPKNSSRHVLLDAADHVPGVVKVPR